MSTPLRWSDSFALGHKLIDKQHRMLVQLINDVIAEAAPDGHHERVPNLLKMLRLATDEHFRTEGSVLWKLKTGLDEGLKRSPEARHKLGVMADITFEDHIGEHISLLRCFDEFESAPIETLGDSLKSWFVDHSVKRDAQLKVILQAIK